MSIAVVDIIVVIVVVDVGVIIDVRHSLT